MATAHAFHHASAAGYHMARVANTCAVVPDFDCHVVPCSEVGPVRAEVNSAQIPLPKLFDDLPGLGRVQLHGRPLCTRRNHAVVHAPRNRIDPDMINQMMGCICLILKWYIYIYIYNVKLIIKYIIFI